MAIISYKNAKNPFPLVSSVLGPVIASGLVALPYKNPHRPFPTIGMTSPIGIGINIIPIKPLPGTSGGGAVTVGYPI